MPRHEPTEPAAELDRLAPARRPPCAPIGYQRWSDLAFLHWRLDASAVRRLLPAGLELDTWDGDAWVGLIPFHMSGVRPRWLPAVPGISAFHETNLRTYVYHDGRPGIWFFSLEAANRLAVWIARHRWHLNYFFAQLDVNRQDQQVHYAGCRAGQSQVGYEVSIRLGTQGPAPGSPVDSPAAQGTLEHFLVERYYLYTTSASGRLWRGQVHHQPYPLRSVELISVRQTLLDAAGLATTQPPDHMLFSPGVQVEIFPLKSVEPE